MTVKRKPSTEVAVAAPKVSLLAKMAAQSNLEPLNFLNTIKKTVMKGNPTLEQVTAFLMVADRYQLDPILKQIHAFADKQGGIIPIVGTDGWNVMAQRHPQFDGEVIRWSEKMVVPDGGKPCPEWGEISVYRKDHKYPTVHREYLDECYRRTGPWMGNTKRMLEHKVRSQGYRIAFGFSGIYDEDEAQRIAVEVAPLDGAAPSSKNADKARQVLSGTPGPVAPSASPDGPPEAISGPSEEDSPAEVDVDENGEVIEDAAVEDEIGQVSDFGYSDEVEEVEAELEEEFDAVEEIKQAFGAVEVSEEEEKKPVLKATKKQLEALVAAKERGGWTDAEISGLIKARYGVAKAHDLDRRQAVELIRHLMSDASPAAQEELGI